MCRLEPAMRWNANQHLTRLAVHRLLLQGVSLGLALGSTRPATLDFLVPFTKLDSNIIDSSIWAESYPRRIVWITFLAKKDHEGIVRASVSGIQRAANVTPSEAKDAIKHLESPDPDSRSPEYEGRRIEKIEGGWKVLNHQKYRDYSYSTSPAAVRQRKHRQNVTQRDMSRTPRDMSVSVSECVSEEGEEYEGNQISGPVPKSNGDAGKWLKDDLDAMFKRNGRAWTYAEEHALFMVTASPTAKDEWNQIKSYHSKLIPKDKPFFPQSAISLLESWSKLLDKAAVYEVPKSPEELKRLQNMREIIR